MYFTQCHFKETKIRQQILPTFRNFCEDVVIKISYYWFKKKTKQKTKDKDHKDKCKNSCIFILM